MNVIRKGGNCFVCSSFPHEKTINKIGLKLRDLSKVIRAKIELFDVWMKEGVNNGLSEYRFMAMYDFSENVSKDIELIYGGKSITPSNE